MANKNDRFYFENLIEATDSACRAATYLTECLTAYDPKNLTTMLKTMHKYEHAGDLKKHEMSEALAKAFVTPVDREDLATISQNVDEVSDKIEEVLQRFYMDRMETVPPQAIEFSQNIATCCNLLKSIMQEFSNFKKPARIREMIVELNALEEVCDAMYLSAMHNVHQHSNDLWEIFARRKVYESLERCADACEHVGDCIETVIMKNT